MIPSNPAGSPLVIGLMGGVAAGKSWVAARLAEHGFQVLDADSEARAVTEDPHILAAIGDRFGVEIVADGLDRPALAALVFRDPLARKDLEAITHPASRSRSRAGLAQARAAGQDVVLDVPLLLEGGLIEECDEAIFVEVRPEVRQARATARGWSDQELARREAAQAPFADKRARCRFLIHNDGDAQATNAQIETVLTELKKR